MTTDKNTAAKIAADAAAAAAAAKTAAAAAADRVETAAADAAADAAAAAAADAADFATDCIADAKTAAAAAYAAADAAKTAAAAAVASADHSYMLAKLWRNDCATYADMTRDALGAADDEYTETEYAMLLARDSAKIAHDTYHRDTYYTSIGEQIVNGSATYYHDMVELLSIAKNRHTEALAINRIAFDMLDAANKALAIAEEKRCLACIDWEVARLMAS